MAKIIWTRTDEAPLLASYSFKPIVEAFASVAGIEVETADISLLLVSWLSSLRPRFQTHCPSSVS